MAGGEEEVFSSQGYHDGANWDVYSSKQLTVYLEISKTHHAKLLNCLSPCAPISADLIRKEYVCEIKV